MFRRVYLDHSATTPVAEGVLEAMLPYLKGKFGNASSIHFFGQEARAAVDRSRHQVAALINARPNEIVFTSGGTEANNLAIRGLVEARVSSPHETKGPTTSSSAYEGGEAAAPADGVVLSHATHSGVTTRHFPHIISSSIEHSAVKNVCQDLEKHGYAVTYVPVSEGGLVNADDVEAAITDNTVLISIMMANNEIGTIQPVAEIGRIVKKRREAGQKLWFHTDAVQAVGKIGVDVEEIGCDMLSLSAHKIYAPKGIGSLYVRRGVRLHPQSIGGRQERGIRGGTESVPLVVALGAACDAARQKLDENARDLRLLRDRFEDGVLERVSDVVLNGTRENRLPNISNLSFRRVEGEGLLINLDMQGIAVSTGSACSSGSLEPSPVIRALREDDELARGAMRFSFGLDNTEADVEYILEVLPNAVENLRNLTRQQK